MLPGLLKFGKEHKSECGSFSKETAAAVINLSCEHCCLYPGEMVPAALYLENGGSSARLLEMIESGELDCPDLFEPVFRQEAEEYMVQADAEQF